MFVLDVVFFKKSVEVAYDNASTCSEEDCHKLLASVLTLLGESYWVDFIQKTSKTQEKPNQTKKARILFIYLFFFCINQELKKGNKTKITNNIYVLSLLNNIRKGGMAQKDMIRNKKRNTWKLWTAQILQIFFVSLFNLFFPLKQKMEKPPFSIYLKRGKVRLRNSNLNKEQRKCITYLGFWLN